MTENRGLFLLGLICVVALTRLLPHAPNFTPVLAIALFSGAMFTDRRVAMLVPLAAMALTDLVLGWHATLPFVYMAVALTALLGRWIPRAGRLPLLRAGGMALGASVLFFVLSNFAVWALQGLYPPTAEGLVACYVAAIPFFHNTLAATLLYAAALFGGLTLAERSGMLRARRGPAQA